MSTHNKILSLLLLSGIAVFANAQNAAYDEFRRQAEAAYRGFANDAKQEYEDFRAKANSKYAEFLKKAWEYYTAKPAIPQPKVEPVPPVVYEEPKPEPAPVVEPAPQPEPVIEVVEVPEPTPQPEPVSPVVENDEQHKTVNFTFYGTQMSVRFPKMSKYSLNSVGGNDLADAWLELASGSYDNLIYDCLQLRNDYKLCDWAYLQMLQTVAENIYGKSNDAVFLQGFLYVQSGYKMRLATDADKLYILVGSKAKIFDMGYYEIDGTMFYPINCNAKRLNISGAYFEQEKDLSLEVASLPKFSKSYTKERSLVSAYGLSAKACVNKNLIDFYNGYPTAQIGDNEVSRWAVYANTPLDDIVKQKLYPSLRAAIASRGELEAVNILLNFVQTAFVYEYDDKVWGGDRAFFSEETLYYPYADCEDRSILFSRLVRDLTGLDVILVYYPGHLAAAVHFKNAVNGDYINLNGAKYVIADPTYINAPVGATMPNMNNNTATVIKLQN